MSSTIENRPLTSPCLRQGFHGGFDEEIEMESIPVTRNGVTTYTEPLPVHVAGSGPAPVPEATRRIVGAFLGEGWARTRKLGRLREYLRQSGTRLDTSRLDLETEMELHHGC